MNAPSGVVTFLFTDIEGSTRRWRGRPRRDARALAVHDEALRQTVAGHGGSLFKHTGDGVCAAFGSPRAAVDAAVAAQRSLALPVRMGIAEPGEAELRDGDYFGAVLDRAARLMAAGHGGPGPARWSNGRADDRCRPGRVGPQTLTGSCSASGRLSSRWQRVDNRVPAAEHAGPGAGKPSLADDVVHRAGGGGRGRSGGSRSQPVGDADRRRRRWQDAARSRGRRAVGEQLRRRGMADRVGRGR